MCVLSECEGDVNVGMGSEGGVVAVSAGRVDGIRGSGIVFGVSDVLGISVVCGIRGVGGVYEMCMCLAPDKTTCTLFTPDPAP